MELSAPGTQTRIAVIDNRLHREIEESFCAGKDYPNTLYLDNTSPMRILVLLSYPPSGLNAVHIVIALNFFQTCSQRNIGSCRDGEFRDG